MLSTLPRTNFKFSVTIYLSSANAFSLDKSKILLFGKELTNETVNRTKLQTLKKRSSFLILIQNTRIQPDPNFLHVMISTFQELAAKMEEEELLQTKVTLYLRNFTSQVFKAVQKTAEMDRFVVTKWFNPSDCRDKNCMNHSRNFHNYLKTHPA